MVVFKQVYGECHCADKTRTVFPQQLLEHSEQFRKPLQTSKPAGIGLFASLLPSRFSTFASVFCACGLRRDRLCGRKIWRIDDVA
jgi:hypothetical protein